MSSKETDIQLIKNIGLVVVLRAKTINGLSHAIEALHKGGIRIIEVAAVSFHAIEFVAAVTEKYKDQVVLGVNTVFDEVMALDAIKAGAKIITSPIINNKVIKMTKRYNCISVAGAFTATEIVRAWNYGADFVKIFPSGPIGPSYIRAIKEKFPHIEIIASGDITLKTLPEFIKAGACAVGVGKELITNPKALMEGNFTELTESAHKFVEATKQAKALTHTENTYSFHF